jgi:hypothetical protein
MNVESNLTKTLPQYLLHIALTAVITLHNVKGMLW